MGAVQCGKVRLLALGAATAFITFALHFTSTGNHPKLQDGGLPLSKPATAAATRNTRLAPLKIACLCFPTGVDQHRHAERVVAIGKTWGQQRLDIDELGSRWTTTIYSESEPVLHTENSSLPAEVRLPKGKGGVSMGPTVQRIWAFRQTLDAHPDVDFIVMVESCTYVLVENVFAALRKHNATGSSKPLVYGLPLRTDLKAKFSFVSGGAGSILSRSAIDRALAAWDDHFARHHDANRSPYDLGLAQLFAELNIGLEAFGDDDGEMRFHVYGPVREHRGLRDSWVLSYSKNQFNGTLPGYIQTTGLGSCAEDTVTFHYVEPPEAEFLYTMWHQPSNIFWLKYHGQWPQVNGHGRRPESKSEAAEVLKLLDKIDWRNNQLYRHPQ